MIVFISDLHLQADRPDISKRFDDFLIWARQHASAIYILGDLFHVWSGDDCADSFSNAVADKLRGLHEQGIALYFMAGNRDFLLGQDFAARAGMTMIKEPYRLDLGKTACLLAHGDRYCLEDKRHQWFRGLTRNRWFTPLFLALPVLWRQYLTGGVRKRSQAYQRHYQVNTEVSIKAVDEAMRCYHVHIMIHGHTHQPGMTEYDAEGGIVDKLSPPSPPTPLPQAGEGSGCFDPLSREGERVSVDPLSPLGERVRVRGGNTTLMRFVLSDWDDNPQFLCYDEARGFIFEQLCEV